MTDVRDRDPEIELIAEETPIGARAVPVEAPRASSLVGRALTPFRRARGRDVVGPNHRSAESSPDPDRGASKPCPDGWSSFLSSLMALIPTLWQRAIYLFAFASDQYVAETRFAVRNSEAPSGADGVTGEVGGVGGGGGMSLLSRWPQPCGRGCRHHRELHSQPRRDRRQYRGRSTSAPIFERPEADFWARLPERRDGGGPDQILEQDDQRLRRDVIGYRAGLRERLSPSGRARSDESHPRL